MASTTVTCRVSASTRTLSNKASSALSASAQSQLWTRAGTPTAYSYVQFGLPRDLSGATVLSAKMRIRGTAAWGGSRTVTAQRTNGPVSYSKMTWKNQPALVSGSTARTGGATDSFWYEINVTADFQLIAQGAGYYGHRISCSEAVSRAFYGATSSAYYPRLVLEYARETPAPAQVSPNGTVGLSKPTFTWAAPSDVTKVQAQADVVGGTFTSPSWDSGDVVSKHGNVDTNALGWAGLADRASADFRFRQYGTLGWSAWSHRVTVTRDDYAPLTVLLPVPGGTSNDPTPEHDWTFADQTKFQVVVRDSKRKLLYDSGVVSGDDSQWTPDPSKFKVKATATLTSTLKVWDGNTSRVPSPGDPGYVTRTWSWTVAPSLATAPATALSAATSDSPAPTLTWFRASGAPDEWIVRRNGDLIARFDGDEGQVSATQWTWDDWTCEPNQEAVYDVFAVVLGKMSVASPASSVTNTLVGLVIYDPLSGAYLNVAGESAGDSLDKVESSVTYRGPFAQGSIKRVLALGGIEGPVSGTLHPQGDRSVDDQLADALTLRSYPTRVLRLMWGFVNVPVVVSNLTWALASDSTPWRMAHRVSFSVAQVDEFETDVTGEGA